MLVSHFNPSYIFIFYITMITTNKKIYNMYNILSIYKPYFSNNRIYIIT